ncbi:MAG TPA: hypothetical protein GXX13_11310 [Acinetobacter towneri]|nr:hypothetical protein [Acinetobacter towneri]
MNLNTKCGVGAVLKLIVRKADTNEIVRETPEFHNLVLNTGLERMAVGTWIDRCCVGTGNSTPVASQVALDNFLASTTTTAPGASDTGGIQVTTAPYYWFGRRTWRFAQGAATGNISEVGLGWGNSNLWNRALIKDANDNPTTITVLADEYLDVVSEVRVYPKESTGSFNLVDKVGAVISTHSYVTQPFLYSNGITIGAGWNAGQVMFGNIISSGNAYSFISDLPMPTSVTSAITPKFSRNVSSNTPLPNGVSVTNIISSSEANFGSHKSFQVQLLGLMCRAASISAPSLNGLGYKWEVDPPIPKDQETILTYNFSLTWGNYEPT